MSLVSWKVVDDAPAVRASQVAVRAALATSDLQVIDQHFGSATSLAVYRVSADEAELEQVFRFGAEAQDGNENKLQAKFAALEGCQVVFCEAVGGSAVRQLMAFGVQPIKSDRAAPVADILQWLQTAITERSQPWLNKALDRRNGGEPETRFDNMETEGWQE